MESTSVGVLAVILLTGTGYVFYRLIAGERVEYKIPTLTGIGALAALYGYATYSTGDLATAYMAIAINVVCLGILLGVFAKLVLASLVYLLPDSRRQIEEDRRVVEDEYKGCLAVKETQAEVWGRLREAYGKLKEANASFGEFGVHLVKLVQLQWRELELYEERLSHLAYIISVWGQEHPGEIEFPAMPKITEAIEKQQQALRDRNPKLERLLEDKGNFVDFLQEVQEAADELEEVVRKSDPDYFLYRE